MEKISFMDGPYRCVHEINIKTFVLRLRLEKCLVKNIEIKKAPSTIISTHCDAYMPHALWYFVRNDDEKK